MDENEFRSFYAQRLGTLTVNSRPIIQDLSMLAQSYPHMAHVVVDAIERQVRTVSIPVPDYNLEQPIVNFSS
jgi:pre-mRNA cleavage complex 2 protein Pcf11